MIKSYLIDDSDQYLVSLPYGEYKINYGDNNSIYKENLRSSNLDFEIKGLNSIQRVTQNTFVECYQNSNGDKISPKDYFARKEELIKECIESDIDDCRKYYSLELEFKYRNFLHEWNPIKNQKTTLSENLPIDFGFFKLKTDCEYIQSIYTAGKDPTIYEYRRLEAWFEIIKGFFKSVGMEYKKNLDYKETANQKIWSNSNHSGIRYLVAFGSFVFSDEWKSKGKETMSGEYKKLLNVYKNDRENLLKILKANYALHFGVLENKKANLFLERHVKKIENLQNQICQIKSMQKTRTQHCESIRMCKDILEEINVFLCED